MIRAVVLWLAIFSVGCSVETVETDPAQYEAAIKYCGGAEKVHTIKFMSSINEGFIDQVKCKNGSRFSVLIDNFAKINDLYE